MNAHEILYIDPGTGSVFYQVILSGILTALVFFKRIKDFFRPSPKSFEEEDNTETT